MRGALQKAKLASSHTRASLPLRCVVVTLFAINLVCTGFAMMEAILVVASVLQRYKLKPVSSRPDFPKPKPLITLRPEAVHISISPR